MAHSKKANADRQDKQVREKKKKNIPLTLPEPSSPVCFANAPGLRPEFYEPTTPEPTPSSDQD